MKRSTKHAIAQRLLGLVGVTPIMLLFFEVDLKVNPIAIFIVGFILMVIGFLSAIGVGPWGRYYSSLCVKDDEAYRATLKTKQPWER